MKIALLTEKYTPDIGGLAISTGRLARLLSSAGHQVCVFGPTSNLPASEKRTLTSDDVSITRFGAYKRMDDTLVDWFELLVEEHKREPFDILHGYFLPQAGFVAAYAGKYLDIPNVVSIRGNDIERAAFDPSKFSHVMYALQNASAVTANASELVKKTRAFIDRDVILIPNGIEAERFKPMQKNIALADGLGLTSKAHKDALVIGFVGELREKKGLKTLLIGYAQINQKHPTSLLIVGEVRAGEDKNTFEEIKSSIPNANIVVTGTISHKDIPAYYSLMDIFVHPSLRDGMPNALLEAMACEKPIVATPVGGIMDVIQDGKNGLFINPDDVNGFANVVIKILSEPKKRANLGKEARKTVTKEFTLKSELSSNLKVYDSIRKT